MLRYQTIFKFLKIFFQNSSETVLVLSYMQRGERIALKITNHEEEKHETESETVSEHRTAHYSTV